MVISGVLPSTTNNAAANRGGRVEQHDVTEHQLVEEAPQRRQVLLLVGILAGAGRYTGRPGRG